MAKGRPIPPVTVTAEERETLERWARRPTTAQALAMRARVVLASAAGKPILHVARDEDISWATAREWRRRFLRRRLDGLLDEPRPGAPRQISDREVERTVTMTLESTPRDPDALEYAVDGPRERAEPNGGRPHLARLRLATPSHRNLQAVERPALY